MYVWMNEENVRTQGYTEQQLSSIIAFNLAGI